MRQILILAVLLAPSARALEVVTLDSKAPLVKIKVMVRAGSASDPPGLEGLAALTGAMLREGSFGDPLHPVTKEKLADLTRPWGTAAYPNAQVAKETTVIHFSAPREVADRYIDEVLRPMLTKPLFNPKELERVRGEVLQYLRSGLRLEEIENFGLTSLDNVVFEGTPYAHWDGGTEKGLLKVDREALLRFYKTHYRPENITVGVSSNDKALIEKIRNAVAGMGEVKAEPYESQVPQAPAAVHGRSALVIELPNAISTGLHAGYPLPLTRKDADFWPLYIANVWFGTHRDDFSHLYHVIREERGYNYGDYSYIEHFEGRPENLFPPLNVPRRYQYFSLWARPVAHQFAPHILRALTWELGNFIRTGLTEEECALSKNKAKILYLSFAETADRLLASRLDDAYYGMEPGYLPGYLARVDAVTCGQVNAAIKKYLQAKDMKYVVVTKKGETAKIIEGIASEAPVWGKDPHDYNIDVKEEDGRKLYLVPQPKLDILRRDAVWANEPLDIPKQNVRVVPAEKMFETSAIP
ncbi:MAG: insulinase family protein [Elusimicrobia bacterium]|nr:insulinase family protein [Elusimicrobiota bacterium]